MNTAGSSRTIKLVLIGDSGVGKTSFRDQYITGRFSSVYRATIGADFISKRLPHHSDPDQAVVLQIWDTAGQERFSALSTAFFRGADAAIFIFDMTRPDSLTRLRRWWDEFITKCPIPEGSEADFCAVFVGNKVDLLHNRDRQANGNEHPDQAPGHSQEAYGSDLPITKELAQRFLQDLIPTPPSSAPTPESSRRRTIHINGPSGIFSPQTLEDPASQPAEIPIRPLSHDRKRSESPDKGFEPESPPRSPSRSRSIGIPSSSPRMHWVRSKSRGLSREGNGTATTNHTTYHTPATSLFRTSSPARGGTSRGTSPVHSQLRRGGSSVMTMETAHSHFSAATPTQTPASRTVSFSSAATNDSEATIKPHKQSDNPLHDAIAESPELATVPLETGPKLFWSSARTGEGVASVFEYVARRVVQRWEWEESRLSFEEGEEDEGPTVLGLRNDWGTGKRGWRAACC